MLGNKKLIWFWLIFVLVLFVLVGSGAADDISSCCKKTKGANAEFCVSDIGAEKCEEGYYVNGLSCEKVPGCNVKGCCEAEGECRKGYAQVACEKGEFIAGNIDCNLDQCRLKCCQVGSMFDMLYSKECESIGGSVLDITNEADCIAEYYASRKVCCRSEEGCKKKLYDECVESGGDAFDDNCAFVEGCECNYHDHTGPGVESEDQMEDVYWFDSCGNQEEKKDDGDCSVELGNVARDSDGDGTWECEDLNCYNVWDNPYTDENYDYVLDNDNDFSFGSIERPYRYHGESWCEYQQAQVGPGLDIPGTRHFVHYCIAGEEKVKTLAVDRSEICTERITGDGRSEAVKVDVLPGRCSGCNGEEKNVIETQECCNKQEGCAWIKEINVGSYVKILGQQVDIAGPVERPDLNKLEGDILKSGANLEIIGEVSGISFFKRKIPVNDLSYFECKIFQYPTSIECGGLLNITRLFLSEFETEIDKTFLERYFGYDLELDRKFSLVMEGNKIVGVTSVSATTPLVSMRQKIGLLVYGGECVPLVPPGNLLVERAECNEESRGKVDIGNAVSVMNRLFLFPQFIEKFGFERLEVASQVVHQLNEYCNVWGDCGANFNLAGKFKNNLWWRVPPVSQCSSEQWPEKIFEAYKDDFSLLMLANGSKPTRPEEFKEKK